MSSAGLRVRQHQRESIRLDAEFVVGEDYRTQLRFSSTSGAPESFVAPCVLNDLSSGGAGIIVKLYVPRLVSGRLRVFDGQAGAVASDGSPIRTVVFEHEVKVRRVAMRSHEPDYELGLSFTGADADIAERVNTLLSKSESMPRSDCA